MDSKIIMGGSREFQSRHQGLVGLRETYKLDFRDYQPFATDDRTTIVRQLENGLIQAANLFTTEPAIAGSGLVVLADPEHVFGAQKSRRSSTGRR